MKGQNQYKQNPVLKIRIEKLTSKYRAGFGKNENLEGLQFERPEIS